MRSELATIPVGNVVDYLALPIDMANPGLLLSLSLFDYNMDDVIVAWDSPIYFRTLRGHSVDTARPAVVAFGQQLLVNLDQ